MNVSKLVAAAALVGAAAGACAQVEFRLAYMQRVPESSPATFPNDVLYKFVSLSTFVGSKDLLRATASVQDGRGVVEIRISEVAAKRFNELAKANARNQDRGSFESHVGLAVIVDGKTYQVIQGVFDPLPGNTMWWRPADDRLPQKEQLRLAQEMARKVRGGSS